jgi:hypothetical protein
VEDRLTTCTQRDRGLRIMYLPTRQVQGPSTMIINTKISDHLVLLLSPRRQVVGFNFSQLVQTISGTKTCQEARHYDRFPC